MASGGHHGQYDATAGDEKELGVSLFPAGSGKNAGAEVMYAMRGHGRQPAPLAAPQPAKPKPPIHVGAVKGLLAVIILFLACLAAFSSRLFAVIRFESIIHEFDPW